MTNHVREMSKIKMSKQLHGPMGEFKGNPGKVMFSTASAINYSCIQFLPFYVEDTEEDKGLVITAPRFFQTCSSEILTLKQNLKVKKNKKIKKIGIIVVED